MKQRRNMAAYEKNAEWKKTQGSKENNSNVKVFFVFVVGRFVLFLRFES